MNLDLEAALNVARRAVEVAAATALPHYERGVTVETKDDESPVTAADRECEVAILEVIDAAYPEHAVLAEEGGSRDGTEPYLWTVDPIDGTRGFTRGGKFWGPLISLQHKGEVIVGAMGMPVLGDVYWAAKGMGCWRNGERVSVSKVNKWSECTVSLGEMGPLFSAPHGDTVVDLVRAAASGRAYGDLMGVGMLLTGLADVWLEAGVKAWDLGPMPILLSEAGGRYTTFEGDNSTTKGHAIGSNGLLHDHALSRLQASLLQS
jgi:histidinol-phosphatase